MLRYLPITQVACNCIICFSWREAVITFKTHEYAHYANPVSLYATMKIKIYSFNAEKKDTSLSNGCNVLICK